MSGIHWDSQMQLLHFSNSDGHLLPKGDYHKQYTLSDCVDSFKMWLGAEVLEMLKWHLPLHS